MLPSKWENLSSCSTTLIYVCKKLPFVLDSTQSKYAPSIFDIYLFQFWIGKIAIGVCDCFSMLISESPASCDNKNLKQFLLHCTSICMSSKGMFKSLFQTGIMNIFVHRGAFFIRYVQLKKHFFWRNTHQL